MNTKSLFKAPAALRTLAISALILPAFVARAASGSFALQFDGADDAVLVPHSSELNSPDMTLTAWIKTSQSNGPVALINKRDPFAADGWEVHLLNGVLHARYLVAGSRFVGANNGINGGAVADGQWHHIAFAVDANGGRVAVDGALRGAQAWVGAPGPATNRAELVLGIGPTGALFAGQIDEVSFWSRAMTGSEIAAGRLKSLVGGEPNLRTYFRFSEGSGPFADNSAAGRFYLRGALTNNPAWVPGVVLEPAVFTTKADAVTSRSARLGALVSPGGTNTRAWFEWGTTTNYGNTTPAQTVGAVASTVEFRQFLNGLAPDVPVHFRAMASNALGVATGSNFTVIPPAANLTQERNDHTATLLPNGKVLVAGGYGVSINGLGFPTNTAELFDPATGRWTPTGSMTNSHGLHTATLLLNGKVLVVDASGAELYDPISGTWSRTEPPNASHNVHTATMLPDGRVLVAGGFGNNPEIYNPATGQWTLTGSLNTPRYRHTATLLPNGKVLVAGGQDNGQHALASAEVFDPATGQWTFTGSLRDARLLHSATLQINGQVIAVGGMTDTNVLRSAERYDLATGVWTPLAGWLQKPRSSHAAALLPRGALLVVGGDFGADGTAEILEPLTDAWQPAAAPVVKRVRPSATLLPTGQLLLAGGTDFNAASLASTELYEPHLLSWTAAPPMNGTRYNHTATLLPNGRVLVAGFGNAELFTPAGDGWTNAPALNTPRASHTATLLPDGQLLVAGGFDSGFNATSAAELFDCTTGLWTNTGSLNTNRYGHTATLLANGRVLVTGGVSAFFGAPIDSAELYTPATGRWANTAPMSSPRSGHTATLLPNGKVLVAGGGPDNFTATATAELFDPATGQWTATGSMTTNRAGHRATLLPDGTVLVAGGVPGSFQLAIAGAEIFDPATGTWTPTAPMQVERAYASATLLPGGRVLIAGGYGQGYLNTAEIYDPAARAWTYTSALGAATYGHTATLLLNGQVLVAGGTTSGNGTNRVERLELGLGSQPSWRPAITNGPSPLVPGDKLQLKGLRFRGVSGCSLGGDKDSPSDVPVVQLRALESERTLALLSTNWSTNAYTSQPIGDFPAGWAMVTVLVNGMPGASQLIEIRSVPLPTLTAEYLSPTSLRVRWPSPSAGFVLQEKPDLGAASWTNVAQAVTDNGTNRFITVNPANGRRFYRLFKP